MEINFTKEKSKDTVWSADCQSYNLFSMLLERQVLTADKLDLSFTPIEYLEQIALCEDSDDGEGYLNLLVMLFSEYFQKNITGEKQLRLPIEKYNIMAKQFIFYCRLEVYRREGKLTSLQIDFLFNPNVKTEVLISSKLSDESLFRQAENLNILLKYT
ncbi:MAG: hypothetical protein CMP39_02870 [Rickettsiales bacterium]|nr:hypothetical protein [Rickettsiales bacterium]|tara:strand:- start:4545 stop:5018 length:474 start_codon:yes stop_codon:yes gene_type:complete